MTWASNSGWTRSATSPGTRTESSSPARRRSRNIVAQAELADTVGVDFFGVGEHHRAEFAVSAPEMVLAAIAARTTHIRLGTAVTVLSSRRPCARFSSGSRRWMLSQNGRAEVVLGRGSFIESFPLFGYDLRDYDALFEQKLELFVELLKEEPVTWSVTMRASLENANVFPKTEKGLRTWVGVGGSPESVVRVARHGLGLMLAIIGDRRRGSSPSSTCTTAPWPPSAQRRTPSRCIRPATSPRRMRRPGRRVLRFRGHEQHDRT